MIAPRASVAFALALVGLFALRAPAQVGDVLDELEELTGMSLEEMGLDVGPQSAMSTDWIFGWNHRIVPFPSTFEFPGTALYHGLTSDVEGSLFVYGEFTDWDTGNQSGIRKSTATTLAPLTAGINGTIWDWEYPHASTNDVAIISAVVDLDLFVYAVELDNTTGDARLIKPQLVRRADLGQHAVSRNGELAGRARPRRMPGDVHGRRRGQVQSEHGQRVLDLVRRPGGNGRV